ncbi:unnamed protein product [Dibothriocephalus latus]|uniref:RRM domain-containing protein n=1 Tax=Dibothriocephalus latus TaxID=60516 RepID=A0A3P6RXJ1_DIBLA|nr:unnamed protein product [Dibothriocephalus latus]
MMAAQTSHTSPKPSVPIKEEFAASKLDSNKTESPPTTSDTTVTDKTIRCIYVGRLRPDVTKAHLMEYFCKFGNIQHVIVIPRNGSQTSLGYGFVYFAEPCAIQMVLDSGPHIIGASDVLIRLIDTDKLYKDNGFRR